MPFAEQNFKGKTAPPRVRVHLRLPQPHLAENVIRLKTGADCFPAVAYARELILKNVVAIVDESLRQRVESGEISKTPCAFLEGDLVAWSGRWRDKAADWHKAVLQPFQDQDGIFQMDLHRGLLETGAPVGFNPKKLRHFYVVPENPGLIRDVFMKAALVAVCHWRYQAEGAVLRPANGGDYAENPVASSRMERDGIIRGRKRTACRLDELGLTRP